jgi:ankyrin repeat protein
MDIRERRYVTTEHHNDDICKDGYLNLLKVNVINGLHNLDQCLITTTEYGHVRLIKVLLAIGADVRFQDDDALIWASMNGHTNTVKLLLTAGANVHAQDNNALTSASKNGHTDTVKVLLAAGANVYARNNQLFLYASHYREDIVKLLQAARVEHAGHDSE